MRKKYETTPDEMKAQTAWVGFVLKADKKRMNKIPMNPITGYPAKSNDPSTWTDFETAVTESERRRYAGIGFMFTPPYVGIDLDHCVEDGQISSQAQEILKSINSYSEYSPSGTGIHIICKGKIKRACKISKIGLEIYTTGRFFTVTGNRLCEYSALIEERSSELDAIFKKYVEPKQSRDSEILNRIRKSKDTKFNNLFTGQWENDYPSPSEADLALCNKLAFWTGKNVSMMDSLFRQSALMRPKWDERHFGDGRTYGQSVIEKAISGCSETFKGSKTKYKKDKLTQGEILTRDCEENIKGYLRDQQGNLFVVLPFDNHLEVSQTNSNRFRNWMARRYRNANGQPPNNEALKQARIQMEVKCEDAQAKELFNRVGWHDDAIYYDLTTTDWQGVRIGRDGWSVVALPPIFRRYQHQAEQVIPVRGGDARDLLSFCNVHEEDYCLFLVAIASFFIPNIPHVIPNQNGEQGTGKSNNSRKIKGLGDPSKVSLISTPKDLEQAQMTADKHWINTFDNLSKIPEWFSDFLCRAVTGEGDMKRSLYTNDDEFIRAYRRCFVLNGIGASAWRPDLLDRSIIFDIPILNSTKSEKEIEAEWQLALPGILGGFFTAISYAMSRIDQVKGHEKFRMADFAQWGAVLAEAMGFTQDEFFEKYQESVDHKWQDTADESALAQRLSYLVGSNAGQWSGTMSELLEQIKPETNSDQWMPKTPRVLAIELMRLAPVMRNIGIDVERTIHRKGGSGNRIFVLTKIKPEPKVVTKGVTLSDLNGSKGDLNDDCPF